MQPAPARKAHRAKNKENIRKHIDKENATCPSKGGSQNKGLERCQERSDLVKRIRSILKRKSMKSVFKGDFLYCTKHFFPLSSSDYDKRISRLPKLAHSLEQEHV